MTEKQSLFVQFYLGEAKFNATQAARLAGYAWPHKQGPALTHHPAVKPSIDAGLAEFNERCRQEYLAQRRAARRRARAMADKVIAGMLRGR